MDWTTAPAFKDAHAFGMLVADTTLLFGALNAPSNAPSNPQRMLFDEQSGQFDAANLSIRLARQPGRPLGVDSTDAIWTIGNKEYCHQCAQAHEMKTTQMLGVVHVAEVLAGKYLLLAGEKLTIYEIIRSPSSEHPAKK